MIGNFASGMTQEIRKRHALVVAIAFALSILIHGALLYCFLGSKFGVTMVPTKNAAHERARMEPMRVLEVKRDERPIESPRTSGGMAADIAGTIAPVDLAKEAESRAQPADKVAIEPPPLTATSLAGEKQSLAEPSKPPQRATWDARQEIMTVEKHVVGEGADALRRERIPDVERVAAAPDVVMPVDLDQIKPAGLPSGGGAENLEPPKSDITEKPIGGVVSPHPDVLIGRPGGSRIAGGGSHAGIGSGVGGGGLFDETSTNGTPYKAIENQLVAEVYVYKPTLDFKYAYFKMEIRRAGAEKLPVIPKDVLLVQDSSNSMAEQRLHFCREGLVRCLAEIGPQDRFNVISFSEKSDPCFNDWADNKPENIEQAKKFIAGMKPAGNTDILEGIEDLLKMNRIAGRPVVALVVTDGRSTTGTTATSDIIGEFSKINDGAISLFTVGTVQTADPYLLDLVSYCNRGDSTIVTGGRWDIADVLQNFMREFSRPVLSEVRFRFARGNYYEVYPVLTSNLYLDRPLVLYGRMAKDSKKIVFQAVGKAGDVNCDMVFDLDLDKVAKPGDSEIRSNWAKQKIYHLIGEQTRKGDASVMTEIGDTAATYGIKIPYKGRF
jgi:hypothetical protein